MMCMQSGGTDIARIRTVVFKTGHAGLLKESSDFTEIFISPVTAKPHTSPLTGLRIDDIHFFTDPAAGQKRITAHLDTFATGILYQSLEFGNIRFGYIFGIRTGTETEDNHLITGLGTLVDCPSDRLRVTGSKVHEYRIFCQPRGHSTIEPSGEQPLTFTVIAIERHFINVESAEGLSGLQKLVRPHLRRNIQYAAGFHRIIPLRSVFRVHHPFLGNVRFTFRKGTFTGIVTFNVDIRKTKQVRITVTRRFRFGKSQVFQLESINIQGNRRLILHFHPFPDNRNLVIDSETELHHHILQLLISPKRKDQFLSCSRFFVQCPAVTCPRKCFPH